MEARRRALGRGLGALISTPPASTDHAQLGHTSLVPLEKISPNPYQPRETFAESGIKELAASIREKGLLQPLLVRPLGDAYQLIAGQRRYLAATRAGLLQVPVTVRQADNGETLELALIENLQRENLNPMEEARAYQRLVEEFGLKQDDIARHVGKSRSAVTNSLRLLQLPPEVQQQIEVGKLSAGHARSILGLGSATAQADIAREVARRNWSVRDTEQMVRRQQARPQPSQDHKALEADLCRELGTRVRLRQNKSGRGRIEIEFYSEAELAGLVDRLTGRTQPPASF